MVHSGSEFFFVHPDLDGSEGFGVDFVGDGDGCADALDFGGHFAPAKGVDDRLGADQSTAVGRAIQMRLEDAVHGVGETVGVDVVSGCIDSNYLGVKPRDGLAQQFADAFVVAEDGIEDAEAFDLVFFEIADEAIRSPL